MPEAHDIIVAKDTGAWPQDPAQKVEAHQAITRVLAISREGLPPQCLALFQSIEAGEITEENRLQCMDSTCKILLLSLAQPDTDVRQTCADLYLFYSQLLVSGFVYESTEINEYILDTLVEHARSTTDPGILEASRWLKTNIERILGTTVNIEIPDDLSVEIIDQSLEDFLTNFNRDLEQPNYFYGSLGFVQHNVNGFEMWVTTINGARDFVVALPHFQQHGARQAAHFYEPSDGGENIIPHQKVISIDQVCILENNNNNIKRKGKWTLERVEPTPPAPARRIPEIVVPRGRGIKELIMGLNLDVLTSSGVKDVGFDDLFAEAAGLSNLRAELQADSDKAESAKARFLAARRAKGNNEDDREYLRLIRLEHDITAAAAANIERLPRYLQDRGGRNLIFNTVIPKLRREVADLARQFDGLATAMEAK